MLYGDPSRQGPLSRKLNAEFVKLEIVEEERARFEKHIFALQSVIEAQQAKINELNDTNFQLIGATSPKSTLEYCIHAAAAQSQRSVEDIMSNNNEPPVVEGRQLFYFLAMQHTKKTAREIGEYCGRDHSVIINGIRVHCARHGLVPPRGMGFGNPNTGRYKTYQRAAKKAGLELAE